VKKTKKYYYGKIKFVKERKIYKEIKARKEREIRHERHSNILYLFLGYRGINPEGRRPSVTPRRRREYKSVKELKDIEWGCMNCASTRDKEASLHMQHSDLLTD
jgi:hypothetical protein